MMVLEWAAKSRQAVIFMKGYYMKRLILCATLLGCTTALWAVGDEEKAPTLISSTATYRDLINQKCHAEELIRQAEANPELREKVLPFAYTQYELLSLKLERFIQTHPEVAAYMQFGSIGEEFPRACTPEPTTSSFPYSRASSPAVPTK